MSTFDAVEHVAGPDGRHGEVSFVGRRGPLLSLVLKNALFTVLTFGLYRFWAKTWIRRYFWNNLRVAGDAVEYVGQAKELFIGFLIAIAVLFPLAMLYETVSTILIGVSDGAQAVWSLIYALVIFLLIQVAIYRMFRYRLSRTIWRGIRFGLDGSVMRFVVLAFGWTLLTILTLGLAYPWMRVALMRYRVSNARYGTTKFDFNGSGRALIGIWLINYPLAYAVVMSALTFPPIAFLFAVAALYVFALYRVREFKYLVGATTIAGLTFESFAETPKIFWMYVWTGIVLVIAAFVVVAAAAGFISITTGTQLATNLSELEAGLDTIGSAMGIWTLTIIAVVLALLLGQRAITALMLHYPLMAHICATLDIANPTALEQVVRSTESAPRFGEGLADAFDVG